MERRREDSERVEEMDRKEGACHEHINSYSPSADLTAVCAERSAGVVYEMLMQCLSGRDDTRTECA